MGEALFSELLKLPLIRELDGREIGVGKRGPVTKDLQKAYLDSVSKVEVPDSWLTLV